MPWGRPIRGTRANVGRNFVRTPAHTVFHPALVRRLQKCYSSYIPTQITGSFLARAAVAVERSGRLCVHAERQFMKGAISICYIYCLPAFHLLSILFFFIPCGFPSLQVERPGRTEVVVGPRPFFVKKMFIEILHLKRAWLTSTEQYVLGEVHSSRLLLEFV